MSGLLANGFENRKLWLVPLVVCLVAALLMLVFLPGWSWSLFDELGWLKLYREGWTVSKFTASDLEHFGRIRPLSPFFAWERFVLLGTDPRILRIERLFEFAALAGWALWWLHRRKTVPLLFAVFATSFFVKSPPLLENLRCMTLSELPGLLVLLAGFTVRSRSLALSYLLLAAAALTKEPFTVFLAAPALLDRRFREAAVAGAVSVAYLAFLFHFRKGGYYEVGVADATLREIARQLVVDFAVVAFTLALAAGSLRRFPWRQKLFSGSKTWQAASLVPFALLYAVILAGKASGYTYHFAPAVFLIALSLGLFLSELHAEQPLSRGTRAFLVVAICVLPLRLCWNLTKAYALHVPRGELIGAIRVSGVRGAMGTNCYIDSAGVGSVADGREEFPACSEDAAPVAACCTKAKVYAMLQECPNYDAKLAQAQGLGLPVLAQGKGWRLFRCR